MSEDFFKMLFEHSAIGVLILNKSLRIEKVNSFLAEMFCYNHDELIDQRAEVLLPQKVKGQDAKQPLENYVRTSLQPGGATFNLTGKEKNGSHFPVEVSLNSCQVSGNEYLIAFVRDVSESKKTENILRQLSSELDLKVRERTQDLSQALAELNHINSNLSKEVKHRKELESQAKQALDKERELNQLKSRFISIASHEFRTPLSGILTSVSLLDLYDKKGDEDKRQKHIHVIKKLVKNLTAMLNDFLSLEKLERNQVEIHPEPFLLGDFVRDIIGELQESDGNAQSVEYHDFGKKIHVHQDRDMFRIILSNLLSNAIKYSDAESSIEVSSEVLESEVKVSVVDQGIGIPIDEQKHIFELFYRAENSTVIQGTGLGLNIVKTCLDLIKGSIEFTSEEKLGTTFTVTFPMEL